MAPTEYSLSQAFKRIEEELIKSMIRNFEKHKAEELEEGFNWDQWQVVQLRELEKYRKENAEKFDEDFRDIHSQLDELLRLANEDAQTLEEAKILDQILKGNFVRPTQDPSVIMGAFGINEDKLNSLIESTTNDLDKAEHAVLRRSNDIYRQVIYDAQVYAANGGTYEQAIDMATKDFCKRGITSIVYKNGSRHTIQDYASMAIRTAHKRAYLLGEGKKHAEYGIHTVRVAKRSDACPLCLRWTGKVLIDDVYGGGTREEAREKRLPLLSTAMAKGFLHPNCKDVYSLYIEGVSKPADPWTEYELKVLADKYNYEQKEKHAEAMIQGWTRVANTRLDPENKKEAKTRAMEWKEKADTLKSPDPANYERVFANAEVYSKKDFSEFKSWLNSEYGIDVKNELKFLDYSLVQDGYSGFETVMRDLKATNEEAFSKISIALTEDYTGYMSTTPVDKSRLALGFSPDFFDDRDYFASHIVEAVDQNGELMFLKGTSPATVGAHEAGHLAEWILAQERPDPLYAWNNRLVSYDIITEATHNIDDRLKQMRKDGSTWEEIAEAEAAMKSTSIYSRLNSSERLAEAFQDVYGIRREDASELNKEIVRITFERIGSLS